MASPLLPLLLLLLACAAAAAAEISYADHCGAVSPAAALYSPTVGLTTSLQLTSGYFSGGAGLFDDPDLPSSSSGVPRSFYFRPQALRPTLRPGVLELAGTLSFRSPRLRPARNLTERLPPLHRVRPRIPVPFYERGRTIFDLSGLFAPSSGQLCMVGTGRRLGNDGNYLVFSAVFKANYPTTSNITSSLVAGSVESLDAADSPSHFEPMSILAYSQKDYEYTQISEAKKSCSQFNLKEESLGFGNSSLCSYIDMYLRGRFRLEYGSDCPNGHCGPFGGNLTSVPRFMSFSQIQCLGDGRLHMFIVFSDGSMFASRAALVPNGSLVAEGFWDRERRQVCLVACRVVGTGDSLAHVSTEDCSVRLSLRFPAVFSIEMRSIAVGRLWSNREKSESSYFPMVLFQSLDNVMGSIRGLKYNYTKLDVVRKSCVVEKNARNVGKKRFPDGSTVEDMRLDIKVTDADGRRAWGYATPLSIGETLYNNGFNRFMLNQMSAPAIAKTSHSSVNVSYRLSYTFINTSLVVNRPTEISAEGVYNSLSGMLCMVGCRRWGFSSLSKQEKTSDSMDYEILIKIQLPPLNPEAAEHVTGTIRSTRNMTDPLYFAPLEVSSFQIYTGQAVESIWRMDIEIAMVLVSLTLWCILIGYQLFYVSKHPDALPSISITMLVILTLGHMIPLVLNFEALFVKERNRQNVLSWSGGWLEVNEVVVRVMTMVAFLLQFRFLQVTWSARSADEHKKGLWVAEGKALRLCLPLYFLGGIIAWYVHARTYGIRSQGNNLYAGQHHSLWEDLISYAGLILDGFLLPQIIFNVISDSKDMALAPVFYFGTTIIRAMPHLYDAYRAHHYVPAFNLSYIYANPDGDLYSSVWDIIVPLEGLLSAVVLYLQQRFGGSYILPRRFRKHGGYVTVSEVSL